jgi:hypothetical protein
MKNNISKLIVLTLLVVLVQYNGYAQENQKLAQTGLQFLGIISDARAASMGEAMTSLQTNSSSLFINPAGMSWMENFFEVSASSNLWIADIKHYTLGMAISPLSGEYGVIGFSVQYVDYGSFIETRVNKYTDKGYDDIGIFKLNALALGFGYAKRLTDRFSIGGHIRWARQDLGNSYIPNEFKQNPILDTLTGQIIGYSDSAVIATNKMTPLVFDFGTQFKTGIKSLVFGMSIRNFSGDMQYAYEGFQTPLTFTIGISMNVMDLLGELPLNQALNVSIDASHYRDHPEQLKIGIEYQIMSMLSIRGGYITNNDEGGTSFGVGVSQFGFAFDYAYTPFGIFNKVQRMTARFSF